MTEKNMKEKDLSIIIKSIRNKNMYLNTNNLKWDFINKEDRANIKEFKYELNINKELEESMISMSKDNIKEWERFIEYFNRISNNEKKRIAKYYVLMILQIRNKLEKQMTKQLKIAWWWN